MPLVLHTFLDDRGMGHPAPAVSTRACYLFQRLVRTLRSSVSLYLDTVLRGCEPHLVRIASTPLATADVPSGLKGARFTCACAYTPCAAPASLRRQRRQRRVRYPTLLGYFYGPAHSTLCLAMEYLLRRVGAAVRAVPLSCHPM